MESLDQQRTGAHHRRLRFLRRQALMPSLVAGRNNLIDSYDVLGLAPWSAYKESENADGSHTITIKKECVIVVLFGHGDASTPHSFVFNKHCQAGGFVGCDAGETNSRVPTIKRIADLKLSNGLLFQPGIGKPDAERFPHWLSRAKVGARTTAAAICKSECACCKKVKIFGELAGKAHDPINMSFPLEWSETIDCSKAGQ